MGSSTALLGSSAHSHSMPSARNNASFKEPALQQPLEHQDECKEVFQARVSSSVDPLGSSTAKLAKMQTCTKNPIRPFLFIKSLIPLIFATEHAGFVTLVVSCKR
jgi:hypothetical protein